MPEVIKPGHTYALKQLDGDAYHHLQFVQRSPHEPKPGTTNQEVCRALIDRVKFLDSEVPWDGNAQIIYHLRMVIALHEARAMFRHIEKHDYEIEYAKLGSDGHFDLGVTHK